MKVKIGPYLNWIGPYQLADRIFFWTETYPEDTMKEDRWDYKARDKLADVLANSWVADFCNWIYKKQNRKIKIKIDHYDTWSMDHTLSLIIVPMLKQLKATKHGAPIVDDKDVPKELRSTSAPPKANEWDTDDNYFKRWDYVLNEMIWAFEQHSDPDNESKFHSGNIDITFEKDSESGLSEMKRGPRDTHKFDRKGWEKWNARKQNGFKLFGKYYTALWD